MTIDLCVHPDYRRRFAVHGNILKQLRVSRGETLLILGAGGSVGIATQLSVFRGVTVIGAASPPDYWRAARPTRSLYSKRNESGLLGRFVSDAR